MSLCGHSASNMKPGFDRHFRFRRYDRKANAISRFAFENADQRFAAEGAVATRVKAGDSDIFTRTSRTGFSVQACVT